MSDSKRATLITVGASNSGKTNAIKTVRLTINLDESNESKYPELNYKELVIAEERKKVENGKTAGLDPFSDNDDDVERVARKFEQKYGGKRTYGRKGRKKRDDFADIGAGYDENDSFIDNTDGYDEMFPPEVDTYLGGFYINSGLLEFKAVSETQAAASDGGSGNRNKRRISSSSSEESSESSSESESTDEKEPKPVANGSVHSHHTEHRKKKNKAIEKKKAKKIRRTDSSAATSGKQTSDDNGHGDGESADSRTSQSDSLTSKPAPSSENAITSDSSRETEVKLDVKLPPAVSKALEDFESVASKLLENVTASEMDVKIDPYIAKLQRALSETAADVNCQRAAWARASKASAVGRAKLSQRASVLATSCVTETPVTAVIHQMTNNSTVIPSKPTTVTTVTTTVSTAPTQNKRKADAAVEDDFSNLTPEQREKMIVETIEKLKQLIDEKKPGMMASYNAECERVQEERKKLQIANDGAPHVEKRLPKRRFPWCHRSRALLARLRALAGDPMAAQSLLTKRVLPLFPTGFVRMPTLLRQADLNKDVKSDAKRQRMTSVTQPPLTSQNPTPCFTEPIQFPSSLTVTTSVKSNSTERSDIAIGTDDKDIKKSNSTSMFGTILNSFSLGKDLVVEKEERKDSVIVEKSKEELYIPPNNIGSITITPVPNQLKNDKKLNNLVNDKKEPLIRVKSPAALNEMAKKDKNKKYDKNPKEKRIDSPLHIDTTYQSNKKEPSPNVNKIEEISQKQIENMRVAENNIPRPALVPVHHSPTFVKPDKRPPETKRKKDVLIVSDFDPLGDIQPEPLCVDDSSSDIELIEDGKNKSELMNSDSVPSKDKVSVREVNHKKDSVKCKDRVVSTKDGRQESHRNKAEDQTNIDIDAVMRNLREMEHSQETKKFNSNSYGGVITSERTSLNKMDGCNSIKG